MWNLDRHSLGFQALATVIVIVLLVRIVRGHRDECRREHGKGPAR